VFVLGGDRYEYRYRRGGKVYVSHTSDRPTVPSWYSERLPLSYDLAREILAFYETALDLLDDGGLPEVRHWLRSFPIDERAVRAIAGLLSDQIAYAGATSVPSPDRIVVEEERDRTEYERWFYVHSCYGRRFNDGLSRLVARRVAARADANVSVAVADSGFSLSMPLNRKVDVAAILRGLEPDDVREELRDSLAGTDLLQRYFRINATRALLILKRYKGYEKSASEQQVSSEMLLGFVDDLEDFAVLEETYRELLEDKLHVEGIEDVAGAIASGDVDVEHGRVESPSPLAFGLATLADSDVVLADEESAALREFHRRVHEAIDGDGAVEGRAD
jgi:ATP-dependent Lhr-like helicase